MTQRLVHLGWLTFAVLTGCRHGNAAAEAPWFQRRLVGPEVRPTGSQFGGATNDPGFATRFDEREIARATKACGADYLVIWTREGDWAFYNSKLQPPVARPRVTRGAPRSGRGKSKTCTQS